MAAARRWMLLLVLPVVVTGFMTHTRRNSPLAFAPSTLVAKEHARIPTKLSATEVLTESGFENKMPSNPDAERIGIREWPKQTKMGAWTERFDTGQVGARYILEGAGKVFLLLCTCCFLCFVIVSHSRSFTSFTGMVTVTLYTNDGFTPKVEIPEEYRVVPGNLVEVMGPCQLEWQTDENAEMVVLTPGYEQGSMLAAVGAIFIVICGALIAGVGQ